MPTLQWSEELSVDFPLMDQTHVEFVDLLSAVETAPQEQRLALWDELVAHTREHFAREDDWMAKTGFAACHCHGGQHHVVLQVMEEIGQRAARGEAHLILELSKELGQWFVQHAQTMDAALASHMQRVEFDPVTGVLGKPEAVAETAAHGCASHTADADESTAVV